MSSNKFVLQIVKGPATGRQYQFDQPCVDIGRSVSGNDLILNDQSVSNQHARITMDKGSFFLQDLKSRNHTYYNGTLLAEGEKVCLKNEDRFQIGGVTIQFLAAPAYTEEPQRLFIDDETQLIDKQSAFQFSKTNIPLLKKSKPVKITIAGIVCLVLLLMVAKIAMKPSAGEKGKVEQTADLSLQPIPLPATGPYGFTNRSGNSQPDKAIFTFFADSTNAELRYTVGGVDSDGEVVLLLNDTKIANAPLAIESWGKEQVMYLPGDLFVLGKENRLIFDNTKNPPGKEKWAVKNVSIEFLGQESCNEAEGKNAYDLGEKMYNERAVSEGNLYQAYQYFRVAISHMEGCPAKPDILKKTEEKLQIVQQSLEQQYNNLIFSYKKSIKINKYRQSKAALEGILGLIPDNKDQRHKEAKYLLEKIDKVLERRR